MKVAINCIHFPPEIGGAVHLVFELAQSLSIRGHDVNVITGYPHYNMQDVPPKYRKGFWVKEQMNGLDVFRVRIPQLPRGSKIVRGFQHFIYGFWLGIVSLFFKRTDVILGYSPPLPLPWLLCSIGKIRRVPVVISIQDLFPREAVELGILTNPLLIRIFEAMESQMHRLADAITVHSPGNKDHVICHGGQSARVNILYNWVDTELIQPRQKNNGFALENGLLDKFVVSYAGTMGWAQDMDTIVNSAALLDNEPDILFLLVGDGVEKEKAQKKSEHLKLKNILWMPMQPWSVYPELLASSDASLINLHPQLRTPVVPSKLLSIMAAARPVVASLPKESDARHIVSEANCGICVDAGNAEALADAIRGLASDRDLAAQMGRRGRAYAEAFFSREACTGKMETILKNAGGDK